MSELELKIEKLIKDQILITESEAQDLATLICELPEIKGGRVGAEVIKGDSPCAVAKDELLQKVISEMRNYGEFISVSRVQRYWKVGYVRGSEILQELIKLKLIEKVDFATYKIK